MTMKKLGCSQEAEGLKIVEKQKKQIFRIPLRKKKKKLKWGRTPRTVQKDGAISVICHCQGDVLEDMYQYFGCLMEQDPTGNCVALYKGIQIDILTQQ
jgi:hypothetical protein